VVLTPDLTKIQRVTGGVLTDNVDELTPEFLGFSKHVYVNKMYEKDTYYRRGPKTKATTIILRSGSKLLVDEAARGITNGLMYY
jgi:chaperonin GroEL (HSP60 family)